jgi:dTDP-4-dehydrorhamnose reductase
MTKATVLITGASGLIGRHVAERLSSFNLFCTSLTGGEQQGREIHPLDLCDGHQTLSFLDRIKPDVIVHTAAVTSVDVAAKRMDYTQQLNVTATQTIAEWCATNRARMIHFSTDFVFPGTRNDYREEDEVRPLSIYGASKWASEKVVRQALDDHVIIRPVLVYGQAMNLSRLNFPLLVAAKLSQGEAMRITADQYRMPTYAEDVAWAVKALINHPYRGTLHLAGPEYLSVYDFAKRVSNAYQLDATLLEAVRTIDMNCSGERPLRSGFDTSLATELLGWKPTNIEIALKRMKLRGS